MALEKPRRIKDEAVLDFMRSKMCVGLYLFINSGVADVHYKTCGYTKTGRSEAEWRPSLKPNEHVCILLGGKDYVIDGIRFEFSDNFGPAVLGKRGDILSNQPGSRHRFWKAVSWWAQQGKRVTPEGVCIYDEPPEPRYVCLGGRNYVEVPEGREPEDVKREWLKHFGLEG